MTAIPKLDCPPRYTTLPTGRPSLGWRVIELAELLGFKLMPWQQYVLVVALETRADGKLVYREVRLTVPRQSGKTILLMVLMLHRCLAFGADQRVAFAMQNGRTAREKLFDDFLPVIRRSPISELVSERRSNGSEALTFPNGSMWKLMSNQESSGHGGTLDVGVIDEAFSQIDGRTEQAMKPAMVTRPNAQLWIVSTAGTNESVWFNEKVDAGRALADSGTTEGVAYFEWSALPQTDPGDESAWVKCMPALGHTINLDVIRSDYMSTPTNEFKRAYLNISLDKRASAPWRVLQESDFNRAVSKQRILDEGGVLLGVEVPLDRSVTALSVAGRTDDGRPKVELADHRGGTAWVIDRVKGMFDRNPDLYGVVIDTGAPAATFIEKLTQEGIPVILIGGDDHARWAQSLFDLMKDGGVLLSGQDAQRAAWQGATKRSYGDRWLWSRRDESVDISPLVSATLALGALLSEVRPESSNVATAPVFAY